MTLKPPSSSLTVTDLHPSDYPAARQLILKGLEEHWGWLDQTKNPDLDDIGANYAGAVFLVAKVDGEVVGVGALIWEAVGVGRIVRMSVDESRRRHGIGRAILQELCRRAGQTGYHRLVLETTETWQDAIHFYLDFGFQITHYQDGDVHFVMDLWEARGESYKKECLGQDA